MDNNVNNIETKGNLKKASIGWFFLAFFFPVVGLILFFIFKNNNLKRGKRLLVGTISSFLISFASFSISIVFLVSLFNNNVYSLMIEESNESYTYKETYNILLLNKDEDNGTFVLENNADRNYFEKYNELYGGNIRVEETTTQIGTWTINEEGYYILSVEKYYLQFDFSGKGKDNYVERAKDSFRSQYGIDLGDKLLDEKRVEMRNIKGLKRRVLLNEEDMSILQIMTFFK